MASEIKGEEPDKPWKYIGYRGFCDFLASDNDLFVLRRFSSLSARVLLALQDELSQLEHELTGLEAEITKKDAPDIHNGTFREDRQQRRLQIILTASQRLAAYSMPET